MITHGQRFDVFAPARICGVALAACLLLAACSRSGAADTAVAIAVDAVLSGDTLSIDGKATVPDGAWIVYAAYRVETPQTRETGYARVADGRFSATADVSGWPAGAIQVDAHFQTMLPAKRQPPAVIERYGESGERMTGPSVVEGGESFRAAIASATVQKP
ncbi:MAG: hypothetical protein GC201_11835 [Alphaproteobacteria bacterium]|nr:hypothetical protein [Alphaproteobacteria bacterium]